ncbi:hypothetical protein B0T24DRAFT_418855 [Lasiosphaeria ovina]|uniref:Uncharacterized protein n=1 Tax=Lasiosphaeria ovina TaxID=92902 RepID=A0AAE0MZ23_9PEZI|nr:hypothetical protein B0T24DRAFT_418855 [Lasiosphaeria ovina]
MVLRAFQNLTRKASLLGVLSADEPGPTGCATAAAPPAATAATAATPPPTTTTTTTAAPPWNFNRLVSFSSSLVAFPGCLARVHPFRSAFPFSSVSPSGVPNSPDTITEMGEIPISSIEDAVDGDHVKPAPQQDTEEAFPNAPDSGYVEFIPKSALFFRRGALVIRGAARIVSSWLPLLGSDWRDDSHLGYGYRRLRKSWGGGALGEYCPC